MTRDMSDREFKAALKRRGWRFVLGWVQFDARADGMVSPGAVMTKKCGRWRLDKRATLAKAIRIFEKESTS